MSSLPLPSSSPSSTKKQQKKKTKQSRRSPLQDLNAISTSMSIDCQRGGCLRFFLSNPPASKIPQVVPKSESRETPKSAPTAKFSKSSSSRSHKTLQENVPKPTSKKEKSKKNPPCLYQWQSGKKLSTSKASNKADSSPAIGTSRDQMVDSAFGSEELSPQSNFKQRKHKGLKVSAIDESGQSLEKLVTLTDMESGLVEKTTPIAKSSSGSVLGCELDDKLVKDDSDPQSARTTTTTTPPIQPSVSPEIQCGSSLLVSAATPTCYGAGHIVAGVSDRRKCRSRGLLVGEDDSICGKAKIFGSDDDEMSSVRKSRMSLVPLPAEASIKWLLSPCDEEIQSHKTDPENGLYSHAKPVGSPNPCQRTLDLCNVTDDSDSNSTPSRRRTRITLLSPAGKSSFQGFSGASSSVSPHGTSCNAMVSEDLRKFGYELGGKNSPFSIDSLSSGNVIRTPESDWSSDRHVGLSKLNPLDDQVHDFGCEIDPLAEDLLRASLSPQTRLSIWDPPGLSFQFPDLNSPSELDNLGISGSTLENLSESQMRISWRDGLASRIFEMDEFDCCRCLSDDENETTERSNKLNSSPRLEVNDAVAEFGTFSCSPDVMAHKVKTNGEEKDKAPLQSSNPCAESISTDGGLIASGDSDWNLCYKNQLFGL